MEPSFDKETEKIEDLARFPSENPNPVIRADLNQILYINTAGEKLFKIQTGSKIPEILKEYISDSIFSKKILEVELKIKKKNYSFAITPIKKKGYVNLYGRDITDHKNAEEQIRYQAQLVENVSDAIISTDVDFNIMSWNKAAESIYGWKAEEIIGKNVMDTITVNYPYHEQEDVLKEFFEKGYWNGEVIQPHRNGKMINVYASVSLLKNSKDEPIGAVSINKDITKRKIVEQKLQESEEKFRTISEQSLFGIGIIQDDVIKYGNEKLAEIFGYTIDEIMKWEPREFIKTVHPDEREFILEQSVKKQKGEKDYFNHYQFRGIKKSGEPIWIDNFAKSIIFDGKPADLVTFIDITAQRESEEKLKQSEINYRDLYEYAPNAYFSITLDKKIISCNNAAERLLGYSQDELYTMKVFDLYAETQDGVEKANELFEKFVTGEEISDQELQMKKKNGEHIWISLSVKPILDKEGNVIESRSMVIDIDDRKKAEKKLKESEKNFRSIFEAIPDLYFLVKGDTTILDYKGSIKDLYILPENLIGKKIAELMPENIAQLSINATKGALESKEPHIVEYDLLINEEKRTFEARHLYLSKDQVSIFIRDITKRKRAEELLKESEEKYREAFNRANFYKDLFAHDMNNVLNSILLSAELISETPKEREKMERIGELFNIIKESTLRGAKLITNVQKLSKLEESEIIIQEINISNFLKDAISFIKNNYPNKEIKIELKAHSEDIYGNGNELLLDAFENIMINAVKYNKNEKIDILIKTSKFEDEGRSFVKLEFIDNGIGIEHFRKEKIFEVGYRDYKGGRGMGLGLSLVKKIIESYGGKITVEDKIQGDYTKGSNFIILIPK